jgi:hypothetical protein
MKVLVLAFLVVCFTAVSVLAVNGDPALGPLPFVGEKVRIESSCPSFTWRNYGKNLQFCKEDNKWHKPDGNALFLTIGQSEMTKNGVFITCEGMQLPSSENSIGRVDLQVGHYTYFGQLYSIGANYFVLCDR